MRRSVHKRAGGAGYRYGLWARLWLKSPFGWLVTVFAFAAVKLIADHGARGPDTASFVYEKAGMLLAALIVTWALSLDFDSGWIRQIWTLPQRRGVVIAERFGFGLLVFMLLMAGISLYMHSRFGPNVWKLLLFAMPVYCTIGSWTVLWTVIARHSTGGLMAALGLWAFAVSGAELGVYSPAIAHFNGVFRAVVTFGTADAERWDGWVIFNRQLYMGAFAATGLAAWIAVRRRNA